MPGDDAPSPAASAPTPIQPSEATSLPSSAAPAAGSDSASLERRTTLREARHRALSQSGSQPPFASPSSSSSTAELASRDGEPTQAANPPGGDRSALLDLARKFLESETARGSTQERKRAFLRGKGLSEEELGRVLAEAPASPPATATAAAASDPSALAYPSTVPVPVPARTYSPYAPPLAPAVAPTPSTLPKFFQALAYLMALSGGATGLFTVLWRTFALPRLLASRSARAGLQTVQLSLFDKFLSALLSHQSLASGVERELAVLPSSEAEELPAPEEESAALLPPPEDEVVAEKPQGTPLLLHPLSASISSLSAALRDLPAACLSTPTPRAAPLGDAISSLSSYITTQQYAANAPRYGPSAGGTGVAQVRSEIRSLKGLLLNRRNFAVPRPGVAAEARARAAVGKVGA